MKSKFLKTLLTFLFSTAFIANLNFSSVHASWKIENDTLIICNEDFGELIREHIIKESYKNIVVSGEMSKQDFGRLALISYDCESINLYDVEANSIPAAIFCNRSNLKKFVLPKNIKTIEALAFQNCYNLEIEKLPENLEFIGNYAFEYCEKLNLIIPEKIKLGKDTFKHCPNVQRLENSKTDHSNQNIPSQTIFSSIISYVCSWL